MFQYLKKLKNYYFPSAKYICESFWQKREIVFWRGFVSRTFIEFAPDESIEIIGLYYFDENWKTCEVILFEDFYLKEKFINSTIQDKYPNTIKKSAKLILEEYQKKYNK